MSAPKSGKVAYENAKTGAKGSKMSFGSAAIAQNLQITVSQTNLPQLLLIYSDQPQVVGQLFENEIGHREFHLQGKTQMACKTLISTGNQQIFGRKVTDSGLRQKMPKIMLQRTGCRLPSSTWRLKRS